MRIRRVELGLAGMLVIAASCATTIDYDGHDLFVTNCANCHGVTGAGDGPLSQDLSVALRDLRRIRDERGMFPREIVEQIIDGRRGHSAPDMPKWGKVFTKDAEAKIDALVDHIHTLQRATDSAD